MIPSIDLPRPATPPRRIGGRVVANRPVSSSMIRMGIELDESSAFEPGQFCMLNLEGPGEMILGRPLSILGLDGADLDLVYKIVGSGTRRLGELQEGARVAFLGPLGVGFPLVADAAHLLLAGGVGLPPLLAWARSGAGPDDLLCFGGRDDGDVPWELLDDRWRVSVDRAGDSPDRREAFTGNVVEMARSILGRDDRPRRILACGPTPLLRAAADLARERGWPCAVSVEERMGCGYGVCRGCVVPRREGGYLASCQQGPVLDAAAIDWTRFAAAAGAGPADDRPEERS